MSRSLSASSSERLHNVTPSLCCSGTLAAAEPATGLHASRPPGAKPFGGAGPGAGAAQHPAATLVAASFFTWPRAAQAQGYSGPTQRLLRPHRGGECASAQPVNFPAQDGTSSLSPMPRSFLSKKDVSQSTTRPAGALEEPPSATGPTWKEPCGRNRNSIL